uniref:Uncharacterized protein n=1 Tax=Caldilinea aerophila TaxID=133453 RepID=A0A7C1FHZ9_9CHLR
MTLPEYTKVYVVIPEVETVPQAHVYSPRLVHPEYAVDFVKQVIEVSADASNRRFAALGSPAGDARAFIAVGTQGQTRRRGGISRTRSPESGRRRAAAAAARE